MVTENLSRAFASTRAVLAGVTPDHLDQPTPCQSWDVRALVNHIVGGAHWFGATTEAGAAGANDERDWTDGDIVASFDAGAARAVAAFDAPGAQEKIITLPFGEFPGAIYMGLATTDAFTHGWDLAKATGQSTDLDPELAGQLLEAAQLLVPDQFRGDEPMPFGPRVEAPSGASAADRLAAFMGRQP
ncbi:MAG: TIGR03086 family metal-binding protein [Acidimicrobiales bacterium]